jgi:hypothetical protein
MSMTGNLLGRGQSVQAVFSTGDTIFTARRAVNRARAWQEFHRILCKESKAPPFHQGGSGARD